MFVIPCMYSRGWLRNGYAKSASFILLYCKLEKGGANGERGGEIANTHFQWMQHLSCLDSATRHSITIKNSLTACI